jgi:hypothetical protein
VESLDKLVQEYRHQLIKGYIQKAYKVIMAFMSTLKSYLEDNYPEYYTSALYFGYMDMTYFAFTPPEIKEKKLKIAIVYLHEAGRFEAWLSGNNRGIQAEYTKKLSTRNIDKYKLSEFGPGVDSIIEITLVDQPNFDDLEKLNGQIEKGTIAFIDDMTLLLNE